MEEAPTPRLLFPKTKPIELNLKSDKNKFYDISIYYVEDKLYFNGVSKDSFPFQKKYEKNFSIYEIKTNKFFLAHESVKEVYEELAILIKNYKDVSEIKLLEEPNKLIIIFPLNTLKVKECLFEINEISVNMNQKFDYIMLKLKEIQEKNELENNLLKNQIGELKKENEQLKQEILNNKIKIQSGEFHTEFPCSAHYMNNQTGSRSFTKYINFHEKYDKIPNVSVSLKGLDAHKDANLRININPVDITNSGFNIKIDTWCDSGLFNVWGSWTSFG